MSATRQPNDRGTPRWVYVFCIVVGVLLLLFAGLHIAGRGFGGHGPP